MFWKPKLVRFADGRYGVRRWSLSLLAHEFYGMDQRHWWLDPEYVEKYAKGTEAQARKAMSNARFDKGVPA